jgi:YfiH family protein
MGFITSNGLEYYQFDSFADFPIVHGIFSRKGGVSPEPWNSLNLGGTVGDTRSNVIENRKRIFDGIGREVSSHFDVWQVHGTEILIPLQPRGLNEPHLRADGILTDKPKITLLMRFADCVPIMLYDPRKHIAGLVHAGWQGTVKKIAARAVEKMQEFFQCDPKDIHAGIGPSIGPDHYEVQKDVIERFQGIFGDEETANFILSSGQKLKLDLWKANEFVLRKAGVENIEISAICTACDLTRWYSHRAENGLTGRFGAVIGLK